jgi:hypothetical protein
MRGLYIYMEFLPILQVRHDNCGKILVKETMKNSLFAQV